MIRSNLKTNLQLNIEKYPVRLWEVSFTAHTAETIKYNFGLTLRNRRPTIRAKVVVDDTSHSLAGYKGRKRRRIRSTHFVSFYDSRKTVPKLLSKKGTYSLREYFSTCAVVNPFPVYRKF